MTCLAKHTKFQVPDEHFKCPKCGATAPKFYIDDPADGADLECDRLHKEDGLYCSACDYYTTGQKFSKCVQKQLNQIACPHCRGTGFVRAS